MGVLNTSSAWLLSLLATGLRVLLTSSFLYFYFGYFSHIHKGWERNVLVLTYSY